MSGSEEGARLGAIWNERYATKGWSQLPDESLVELATALKPGRALDLGCGTGRNSMWLARQGWDVTCIDASAVGLKMLSDQAASAGLHPTIEQADLLTYVPTPDSYDLVVIANIHLAPEERGVFFDRAAAAVAPGGHLYVIGHHVDAFGKSGPPTLERLYEESLFRDRFAGFSIQTLERRETLSDMNETEDVSLLLWAVKNDHVDGVAQ